MKLGPRWSLQRAALHVAGRSVRELVSGHDPAVTRRRYGRLAAALFGLAGVYGALVLPTLQGSHRGIQLVLIVSCAPAAVVLWLLPWRRLPDRATLAPAMLGLLLLTVGTAGMAGALHHYLPCVAALFAYVAVTQPAGWSLRAGALMLVGTGAATLFGRQHAHHVELLGGVAALALLAEVFGTTLAHARTEHELTERLYDSLGQLLSADDPAAAARQVSDLAASLLAADGAVVLLSDSPGSPVFRGAAGAGLGAAFPEAVIDTHAETSGVATCVTSRRRLFVPDAPASPLLAQRFIQLFRVGSVLYLPVPGEGGVVGVIIAWWTRPRVALDDRHDRALELLSTEAGLVLERLRTVDRLDVAASTDPLTGLGNRRAFLDATRALGPGSAVVLFDLDSFKPVNDSHGHAAGDQVLVAFARALDYCVRDDVVARIGGDEFAIVLRAGAPKAVDAVLRRLDREWDRPRGVTYCHGVAEPLPGEPASATVKRADTHLYAAKAARHRTSVSTGGR